MLWVSWPIRAHWCFRKEGLCGNHDFRQTGHTEHDAAGVYFMHVLHMSCLNFKPTNPSVLPAPSVHTVILGCVNAVTPCLQLPLPSLSCLWTDSCVVLCSALEWVWPRAPGPPVEVFFITLSSHLRMCLLCLSFTALHAWYLSFFLFCFLHALYLAIFSHI